MGVRQWFDTWASRPRPQPQPSAHVSRLPFSGYLPRSYVRPAALAGFEESLDARVAQLLQGAADAGNGDVYDQLIDTIVQDAHFELEVEKALHQSTCQHLIMHTKGTGAKVAQQLIDARERVAQAQRSVALAQERLDQADAWALGRVRWLRRKATRDASEGSRKPALAWPAYRRQGMPPSAQGWSNSNAAETLLGEVSTYGNHD
ncbi:MAG: hypothetical protein LBS58_02505 [Coriobacteriales bacterium]|nr:hypothetical protein [Coriobacteriales bacterium]